MDLAELQHSLQAHLLRGDRSIVEQIQADARFPIPLRLGVYADAYVLRLIEVLGESFPALLAALGPKRFARHVGEFVRAHPSRYRSIRDYGEALPEWIGSQHGGIRGRGLGDLARFEWAIAGAFDAADVPAIGPERLAGIEVEHWPRLRFTFAPSVRRMQVTSNCVAWWKFACAEQSRPTRWRSTCTQHWLVWRQDLAVFYRRLPQQEARALDGARAGHSFAQWCEGMSDPALAARFLQRWFADQLLVDATASESA